MEVENKLLFGLKVEEWTHKPILSASGGLHGVIFLMFPNWVTQVFRNALKLSCSIYTRMEEGQGGGLHGGIFHVQQQDFRIEETAAITNSKLLVFFYSLLLCG